MATTTKKDNNTQQPQLSIENVLKEMNSWRKTTPKAPGGIPDEIWQKCFALATEHGDICIRRIFRLNTKQYEFKYKELQPEQKSDAVKLKDRKQKNSQKETTSTIDIDLCEVTSTLSPEGVPPLIGKSGTHTVTPEQLSKLKSTSNDPSKYLDYSTMILECIRKDGQRLKIHVAKRNLADIMHLFYKDGCVVNKDVAS